MNNPDETPPLRMAPLEAGADLARRLEREKRAAKMTHEDELSHSLAPFRVGSVRYLNAVPLTRGLEDQILFATPSELAAMLRRDELDAALVSVTEVLTDDRYDVLDGISVSSLGEVKSVLLIHRGPIEDAREIYCDPASLTSVNLLRVLLAERDLQPEYKTLASYEDHSLPDYALLIGDPAIDFLHSTHTHEVWDLGTAWYEMTRLPFVYAVWALRRGIDYAPLARMLRSAKEFGMETLDHIIRDQKRYDHDFRKDYLSWHIHYHLGQDERSGLRRFMDLMEKHDLGPIQEPRFVT